MTLPSGTALNSTAPVAERDRQREMRLLGDEAGVVGLDAVGIDAAFRLGGEQVRPVALQLGVGALGGDGEGHLGIVAFEVHGR